MPETMLWYRERVDMIRVCRWSLITALIFMMMPFALNQAFAAPDSHDIIQKLAVESYGAQTVLNGKSIQIPKRFHGPQPQRLYPG